LAEAFVAFNRQTSKSLDLLQGRTLMNLFFENSTRTQSSSRSPASAWAPTSST
jgi:aspartate carbamoyltransferase catalytic subunit